MARKKIVFRQHDKRRKDYSTCLGRWYNIHIDYSEKCKSVTIHNGESRCWCEGNCNCYQSMTIDKGELKMLIRALNIIDKGNIEHFLEEDK